MPLRAVLRYLLNNEQLIQKVAESYPVRRAAQLTAYMFHRGKELGEDGLEKLKKSDLSHQIKDGASITQQKASRFASTFRTELGKGLEELDEKMKKHR
ncbi:protein NCBP2AS2 homolog [Babylonia areolata]|uniref:protein NCBP2AS2 homolog n=1 Tax=Babylonia areolata TaxID=304850 RepID=UPI003FD109A8